MSAAGESTARFELFIGGDTARSRRAVMSLRSVCDASLGGGGYELSVIDVTERPDLADEAHIFATPTVIKFAPGPVARAVGDLSDLERLALVLDLQPPSKP